MKILTINTKFSGGGAAKIAYSIHNSINKSNENESIFVAGYGNKLDKYCIKINNDKLKYISALSFRLTSKEIDFSKNVEKYIEKVDIVHLHNLHGYFIDYEKVLKIIIKYDKPLVWTLHDIWPFTGRCAIATDCNKWKSGCNRCINKSLYPKSLIDNCKDEFIRKKNIIDKLNKHKTVIVTPSKWLKNLAEESILKEFRIINIPNGIYIEKNIKYNKNKLKQKYGIPLDKKVILFVAANPNDKLKGMDLLEKSIKNLTNIIFISVGKNIKMNYENLIQLGYISSNEKMNEIYSISDIYINPSLSENFPTTNLEAFANKLPVIGFNIGGIVEQLEQECGILVDQANEDKLLDTIVKSLDNNIMLKKVSEKAFNKYKNEYSFEMFINRYNEVYNEVLDNENSICNKFKSSV